MNKAATTNTNRYITITIIKTGAEGYTTKASYNSSPVRVGGSPMQTPRRMKATGATAAAARPSTIESNCSRHYHHHHRNPVSSKKQANKSTPVAASNLVETTAVTTELFNIYGLIRSIPSTHSRPNLPPCFKHRKCVVEAPPPFIRSSKNHHVYHSLAPSECYSERYRN